MTPLGMGFILFASIGLLVFPRRWAPLPLLLGACYMTSGQYFEIGSFTFTTIRALLAVGIIRIIIRNERFAGRLNFIDVIIILWGIWALISSRFHTDPSEALTFRLGLVYNAIGIYFLLRIFIQSVDDALWVCKITIIVIIPLSLEMLSEQMTGRNWFSFLGGVPEEAFRRAGRIRAQGTFSHPILAGAIGASVLPLALSFWKSNRKMAYVGIAASCLIVYSSMSSGPIMTAIFCLIGMWLWKVRVHLPAIRKTCLIILLILHFTMKAPVYYLIARIDLTGSSTGWHRARLIESSLGHLREWWWAGTDYTRHWMPTGVTWSPDHTDITNYYIKMGVIGGLPLMLLFIALLTAGFIGVGRAMRGTSGKSEQFLAWTLGAVLFGHVATFFSATYVDQSVLFLYLVLALISSLYMALLPPKATAQEISSD